MRIKGLVFIPSSNENVQRQEYDAKRQYLCGLLSVRFKEGLRCNEEAS